MPARRALAAVLVILATGMLVAPTTHASTTTRIAQRYEIEATLDLAARRLEAVATIELTNRSASAIDHVNLSVMPRALGYLTMPEPVSVDGTEVSTEWTTGINLRVPLDDLEPRATATVRVPFRLDVARSPDAFTARTSAENGVLSVWPVVPDRVDRARGLRPGRSADLVHRGDDPPRPDDDTPLPRDAVACPGLGRGAGGDAAPAWTCESTDVRDFSFVVNPRFRLTERSVDGADAARLHRDRLGCGDRRPRRRGARRPLRGVRRLPVAGPRAGRGRLGRRIQHGVPAHDPPDPGQGRGHATSSSTRSPTSGSTARSATISRREPWLDEGFADFSARWLMGIGENQCSTRPVEQPGLRLAGRGRRPAATGRAATATSTPSSTRAPSSSPPCAAQWATTPSSPRCATGSTRHRFGVRHRGTAPGSPPGADRCGPRPDLRRPTSPTRGRRSPTDRGCCDRSEDAAQRPSDASATRIEAIASVINASRAEVDVGDRVARARGCRGRPARPRRPDGGSPALR